MKISPCLLSVCLLAAFGSAHAELYKWVGPDGKVTYSDIPPPSNISKVETKRLGGTDVDTSGLPFELAEAVRNQPIVLYTTASCLACDGGRKLLNERGIPYTEKTVNNADDATQLKKAGGENRLPFLTIGRTKLQSFQADNWNTALTAAGYPESNHLPKNYRNPAPQPAAPQPEAPPKQTASNPDDEAARHESAPPPAGKAPPDFHF